jgi:hypothetical protein
VGKRKEILVARSRKPQQPKVETPSKTAPVDVPPWQQGKPVMDPGGLTPWSVFKTAMHAVPALKYALGVLGIISTIAITRNFGVDAESAVFGTIIMLVLMVALVVFAALTAYKSAQVRIASFVMMWSFLVLTILTATLLFTAAFFEYPKPLKQLILVTKNSPQPTSPLKPGHGYEPIVKIEAKVIYGNGFGTPVQDFEIVLVRQSGEASQFRTDINGRMVIPITEGIHSPFNLVFPFVVNEHDAKLRQVIGFSKLLGPDRVEVGKHTDGRFALLFLDGLTASEIKFEIDKRDTSSHPVKIILTGGVTGREFPPPAQKGAVNDGMP